MPNRLPIVAAALLCTGLMPAHAEHPIENQPEIVVQGDVRNSVLSLPSLDLARERIEMTPGGVDIIDAEDYRRGRASTLEDLLKYSPGVYVQPRFGSDEARLSIRGSGIQRTFHLRGIKLLQDGVPLNMADGGGDFQAIDGLASRYIEVYRGANALQFGSTTLGGAINFVSPTGYDAAPLAARAEIGSFEYKKLQLAASGVTANLDGFLSYTHADQEGFRDHANQNNDRVFGNVGYRFNDNLETRFFLAVADSDSDLPGNLTKARLNADPGLANPINNNNNQKRDFTLWRVSNRTVYSFGDSRLEFGAFYSYKDLFHPIFQVLDIVTEDYGADVRFISEAPLAGHRNQFTLGFSPVSGTAEDDRFRNLGGARGARTNKSDQTSTNFDVYAEDQFYITPRLAAIAGAQFSHAERELDDKFLTDGADNSVDETFTAISPKFGTRFELTPAVQFFGNFSRSFEPPSFGELAGGPNITPVDAQTAWTFETGTRGTLAPVASVKADWDIAYYHAQVQDELLSLTDALGNPLGTINADETMHQGIELGLDLRFFDHLTLRQVYNWNDFNFDGDAVFGDNPLAGIPEHQYRAEALYEFGNGWYLGPNVEWVPQDFAVDHANTLFADAYTVLGARGGYRAEKFSFFIEGRNLTNETYAASTGVIANARGLDATQFLPGDEISGFMGIEIKL